MRKYLLSEGGNFYKANLHCHSTVSDAVLTPEELKKIYKDAGYSVLAFTDHDVLIPHPELNDGEFLTLNGYEFEIEDWGGKSLYRFVKAFHVCLIATEPDNLTQVCYHRTEYVGDNAVNYRDKVKYDENEPDFIRTYTPSCMNEVMRRARENGFFVIYNHPTWSLEGYEDYMRYEHMHAMEICNWGSFNAGYPEYNEKEYDDMLRGGKRIFCIGADDTHDLDSACGAFTMIKAERLEYRDITDALLRGDFYASQGPLIHELYFEDGKIHVSCSDACRIRINTASRRTESVCGRDGEPVCRASFEVIDDDGYVRITVVDERGRHANTNAYFVDELLN